jgi:hypothetical protein
MNDLHLPASKSTPGIDTDFAQGRLRMQGDSYPENSFEFFTGIIQWVEDFLAQQPGPLQLDLGLVYMNTSSVRAMMDIFDLLENAHVKGRSVRVEWRYDPQNARVRELAEEFREDYSFPFEILADD